MLNGNQIFAQSVGRLNEIYKNDPARLEAIKDMTTIALEAFGDVPGLGSNMGLSTVETRPHHSSSYSNASGAATATPAPSDTDVAQAMMVIRQYAKSNPIECQRWLNDVLNNDIRNAAQFKLSNLSDDWEQAFNDEVSGKADKDREATSKKLADDKAAKEKADKEKADKAAEKEKKAAEKEKKADQKNMEKLADNYSNTIGADDGDETSNTGVDGKKQGVLKRLWRWLRESAEQAIREGDMAKLESIRGQMLQLKGLCEAAGMDTSKILVG